MIAIYARQSLDKKDSISIETQIEFCKRELIDGSEPLILSDKGFSGKNTDRPGFIRLMKAVEDRKVTKVIVYRLDRISRSLADFANIMETFETNKVSFASANEKFDTSTPAGRAMLYVVMVFAQLERETIAERIRDNYYARGKAGAWPGGPAPFGFDNSKTIVKGKRGSTLEPNADIETVKEIFSLYANTSASLGAIARIIRGKRPGEMWNNVKLSRILHNPVYVKANADVYNFFKAKKCILVNDVDDYTGEFGCSVYGRRESRASKYLSLSNQVVAILRTTGIIEPRIWLKCQLKLEANVQLKNSGKGRHTWLTGLVKCAHCEYSMVVRIYDEKRYFACSGRSVSGTCAKRTLPNYVDDIERLVGDAIKDYSVEIKKGLTRGSSSNEADINRVKIELSKVESQIDRLIDSLSASNDVLVDYVNKKIVELDNEKDKLLTILNQNAAKDVGVELPDLSEWDSFNMELKKEIANELISRIFVANNEAEIVWRG